MARLTIKLTYPPILNILEFCIRYFIDEILVARKVNLVFLSVRIYFKRYLVKKMLLHQDAINNSAFARKPEPVNITITIII